MVWKRVTHDLSQKQVCVQMVDCVGGGFSNECVGQCVWVIMTKLTRVDVELRDHFGGREMGLGNRKHIPTP